MENNAAVWLSIVSLLIAALALLWNILNATVLDKARLEVRVEFSTMVGGIQGTELRIVTLTAVNIGRRPVRLSNLMLVLGTPPSNWRQLLPRKWRTIGRPELALMNPGGDTYLVSLQTSLPIMLSPGEAAYVYDYERDPVITGARDHGYDSAYAVAWGSTTSNTSAAINLETEEAPSS